MRGARRLSSVSYTHLDVYKRQGIAYPAAYAIARIKFKGKEMFSKTILFCYLLPSSVLYIPLYIFVSLVGLSDSIWGLMLIYPTFTPVSYTHLAA